MTTDSSLLDNHIQFKA